MADGVEALRAAVATSAACERLRRRTGDLRHLRRRAEGDVLAGRAPELAPAAAQRWLRRRQCGDYLGGGTFGQVYRTRLTGEEAAVKWIASYPSEGRILGNAEHEYALHRLFAAADLAWAPLGLINARAARQACLSRRPEQALRRNVAGIVMPVVDTTLDRLVRAQGPQVLHADLGARLVALLRGALAADLAHNDAKANNVGVLAGDVRFIDFGRALGAERLAAWAPGPRRRLLEEVSLADALRLAASLRRLAGGTPALAALRAYAAERAAGLGLEALLAEPDEAQLARTLARQANARLLAPTAAELPPAGARPAATSGAAAGEDQE